ncbi:hypothetical protein DC3_09940 [Deinococcus cellulosilyticus NBRC 106333 = KACC 11606]|uniref:Uncharacterized protein n=1 Tax=Deinococcus cellulosilyticus (strain DSM 18568 / NBRC 106333 / KACC 11606 / 5516J-15) TaxID=1223518 RepID=A0A511MXR8_DEIC1|nr:hypothetical protein DC3_09940 [Deinococcus cellulosilyticus NBRC 106333 = KACC 11606]
MGEFSCIRLDTIPLENEIQNFKEHSDFLRNLLKENMSVKHKIFATCDLKFMEDAADPDLFRWSAALLLLRQ